MSTVKFVQTNTHTHDARVCCEPVRYRLGRFFVSVFAHMYCKALLLWVAAILALLAIGAPWSADAAPMIHVRRRQAVNGIRMPGASEAAARPQGGMAPVRPERDIRGNEGRFAPIPAAINAHQPAAEQDAAWQELEATVCFWFTHSCAK